MQNYDTPSIDSSRNVSHALPICTQKNAYGHLTVHVIIKFPPNARIRVRASDKCTNERPQMHEQVSEANGYGRPTDYEYGACYVVVENAAAYLRTTPNACD